MERRVTPHGVSPWRVPGGEAITESIGAGALVSPNSLAKRLKLPDYSIRAIMENATSHEAKAWAWLNRHAIRLDVFGKV
jgi:hypothetical protein